MALLALTIAVTIGGGIADNERSSTTEQLWEEHAPIYINGNEDFKTTAQNEGWFGNGSSTNPYLIEGLNITTPSTSISIENTNMYFHITNCLVESYYVPYTSFSGGIYFANVSNAIISNNTVYYVEGIRLRKCTNISFISNKARVMLSVEILSSKNIQIINNTIKGLAFGIEIPSSKNIQIINNNISQINADAIVLQSTENSVISGNRINTTSQGIGISIQGGQYNSIRHNNIRNCNGSGIFIHTYEGIHIIENTISNNNGTGIDLRDSVKTNLIGNNVSYNAWDGLFLYNTREITLSTNNITNNGRTGLLLEDSEKVKISDNNVTHNHDTGITLLNCRETNITTNNISNNAINGIILWNSTNNNVSTNVIALNHDYGVYLTRQAISNIIEWNDFIQNNQNGTSQAYDEGEHNIFDYNYWDDWTAPDTNYDGIVDRPYPIAGPENNTDLHPRTSVPYIRWNVLFGLMFLVGIMVVLGLILIKQKI
ncbi:MAG: nitrous oxide reductase family maturation protein NosD [Candidatus Hodarchaeota archaeon]